MNANLSSEEILHLVNEYISNLSYTRKPQRLYEPIRYVLSMGGKRIRPTLMLLAYNMYKENPESILPVACALETYHNYTLLHDDLMDNAPMRRGHQTVHEKWDANTAILSGDTMLVLAFQRLSECPADKFGPIFNLFTETALQIGEGQQYDMDFEQRDDVSEEEYIEMIRLKTSVLLACAMKMGAILADAPQKDATNLYKYGEHIGLAFQLQDDYLDVYGNPEVFGKAIGGDILSNKKTYMLINAMNRADKAQREELNKWLAAKDFDPQEKIKAVTQLYNEMHIDELAIKKINQYFEESKTLLSTLHVDDSRKQELEAYALKMMKRKK